MLKTEFNEKESASEFISIGYIDGKKDQSINTAEKMLIDKLPIGFISKYTDLEIKEIKKLAKNLGVETS